MNNPQRKLRIGFAANPVKPGAIEIRQRLMAITNQREIQCVCIEDAKDAAQARGIDLLTVIGGDGTILRYANLAAANDVPLLGINSGRIGFLSEIVSRDYEAALELLAGGAYKLEKRMMLRLNVDDDSPVHCLNDVLIFKNTFSGTAEIDIVIDGAFVGKVVCDGMIAATPTGATAYSLSAGGPVIAPGLEAMIITPVCSHTLHIRPIVAGSESICEFRVNGEGVVAADGERVRTVSTGDRITVCKSQRSVTFIRFNQHNLYELIRDKLS